MCLSLNLVAVGITKGSPIKNVRARGGGGGDRSIPDKFGQGGSDVPGRPEAFFGFLRVV